MRWIPIFLLLVCLSAAAADDNSRFVTHAPYLDVMASTQPTAESVGKLPAGAEVRVLGTQGDWTQIRTQSGLSGWVPSDALTAELPPRVELTSVKAENGELQVRTRDLQNQLNDLKSRLASTQQALNAARSKARSSGANNDELAQAKAALDKQVADLQARLKVAQTHADKLQADLQAAGGRQTKLEHQLSDARAAAQDAHGLAWRWVASAVLAALLIGALLGIRWRNRRIRNRLGGLEL